MLALVGSVTGHYGWSGFTADSVLKVNTAVLSVCIASLLLLDSCGRSLPAVRHAVALLVVGVAAVTLLQDVTGVSLGLDQLLLVDGSGTPGVPGRPAPSTSVALIAFGVALLLSPRSMVAHGLVLGSFSLGGLAVLGYLYDAPGLYGISGYTAMSLNTSLVLAASAVAFLAAHPDAGLAALVTDTGVAGQWVRGALPAVLLGPALLGWVRLHGQRAGLFGTEYGLALM